MTLAIAGSATVALKEGHSATRARWSAATLCYSSSARTREVPGLEVMFKAAGETLQGKLSRFAEQLRLPWLSVVTAPKGTYRESDVLNWMDRHLDAMTPGRRWRLLLLDVFAAQTTEQVRRAAWKKGYVLCIHGGGTTGITQVNDTDLHQHLRRRYTEMEAADLLKQARLDPKATPIPRPENCSQWMASVWADPALHVPPKAFGPQASRTR